MKTYWGSPKATKEILNDGWLHTGDVGYIDDEGFLVVLGRKDNRLISPEGETFSPEGIEESLASSYSTIHHVLLYNDQKPYTVALIVPNKQTVRAELEAKGLTLTSADGQRMVVDLFANIFQMYRKHPKLKKRFPEKWIPATFAILGEAFTVANGFLNSSLKMVRKRIMQHYQDRIDFLYTTEGRDAMNVQNMTIVGRMADQF
jgi:long-chain acyl-CoA synthetase